MLYSLLLAIYVFICVGLIGLILLQQGKGADVGASLGGSSQTVFGSQGSKNFVVRATTGFAVGFFGLCLFLNYMVNHEFSKTHIEDLLPGAVPATQSDSLPPVLPQEPRSKAPEGN